MFDIDLQRCPNCGGGELKIIAAVLERPVIEEILDHMGWDPQPPPKGRARETGQPGPRLQTRPGAVSRAWTMAPWLPAHGIACGSVKPFRLAPAERVKTHALALAREHGRPVKELGGSGRRHDWRIGRRIREAVGAPLHLAGGLNAGNVRAAVEAVQPHGPDLCSRVRCDGGLDPAKLRGLFDSLAA